MTIIDFAAAKGDRVMDRMARELSRKFAFVSEESLAESSIFRASGMTKQEFVRYLHSNFHSKGILK